MKSLLSTLLIALAFTTFGFCDGVQQTEKQDLRYDGKPFAYWRNYLRTELKAERRIDAIQAIKAYLFGDAQQERLQQVVRAMIKLHLMQQQSPITEFRLVNKSGRPIDAVWIRCSSDPMKEPRFWKQTRLAGPYGRKPTLLLRIQWPESFVLDSTTLICGKQEAQRPLNFTCQPGRQVLVVVDKQFRVSVQQDK